MFLFVMYFCVMRYMYSMAAQVNYEIDYQKKNFHDIDHTYYQVPTCTPTSKSDPHEHHSQNHNHNQQYGNFENPHDLTKSINNTNRNYEYSSNVDTELTPIVYSKKSYQPYAVASAVPIPSAPPLNPLTVG